MALEKEETSSIDVLFTGLIREHDVFKKSLNELVELRKRGLVREIILSTWKGEPSKYSDMLKLFQTARVKIIEDEQPAINAHSPYYKGKDYIWHQMKALENGLKNVDENRFVLKTRSDVYINPKFIEKLALEKEELLKIKKDLPKGNVFRYKVWVPWFELTKPFFMADESFFGSKEDLQKLYNYNQDYFEKYDLGPDVHHVMRYIHPFLEQYPIFQSALDRYRKDRSLKNFVKRTFPNAFEYLKRFSSLKNISEKNRFSILRRRLEDEEYIHLISAYYSVLHSHFYIDLLSFKNQVVFRDFYAGDLPKSDGETAENNFSEEKVRFPGSGMIYFYEMDFVDSLCNKKIKETPLGTKLLAGVKKFESSNS